MDAYIWAAREYNDADKVNFTQYTVHCTVYTVHCTLYREDFGCIHMGSQGVHGTLYTYTVHCTLCTPYTIHNIHWCTLYTVHDALYTKIKALKIW